MQANTVHVENFDGLVALFTSIQPDTRRTAVLRAIADPNVAIGVGDWKICLFAVAAQAAAKADGRRLLAEVTTEKAAAALGIPRRLVEEGYCVWDKGSDEDRAGFRNRIRAYLQEWGETPLPAIQPRSAARRLVASVRELVGVK